MTKNTKTLQEYQTEAMLMGMGYDETINTFYKKDGVRFKEFDADTMEPLTRKEIYRRRTDHWDNHGVRS